MIKDPASWLALGLATAILVVSNFIMMAPRAPAAKHANAVCSRMPPCESVQLVAYRVTPDSFGLHKQSVFKVAMRTGFETPARREAYLRAFIEATLNEMGWQVLPRIAPEVQLQEPRPFKGKPLKH